ncbi:hypothetical protein RJ641_018421 [Dillenia turbinata]|uniref:Uncharacterized protein n=1 Tax=Dillenia turbinata TaxID=194707 RepID=A0AAN8YZ97_9MAGN
MMLKQGIFMLHCAMKWFLTTGRRPLPIVAAIELNGVRVRIDDVAKEVHATVSTSKLRYKELRRILLRLPKYMELKSRLRPKDKGGNFEEPGFSFGDVLSECLRKEVEYTSEDFGADKDYDSKYFEIEDRKGNTSCSFDDRDEDWGKKEIIVLEHVKTGGVGNQNRQKMLLLKQVLEKDVGFDVMPPSFVTGCLLVYDRRKQKIAAANVRIEKIMHPSTTSLSNCHDQCCPEDAQDG